MRANIRFSINEWVIEGQDKLNHLIWTAIIVLNLLVL